MSYLAIIRAVVSILELLMRNADRKQLEKVGSDREIAANLSKIQERIAIARKVEQEIAVVPDSDIDSRLRDGKWLRD